MRTAVMTPVTVRTLLRISLTVSDVPAIAAFYKDALGFDVPDSPSRNDPALARLLGVDTARGVRLQRGAQQLELVQTAPRGAPCPQGGSNDAVFQHVALVTADMAAAYARLCAHPHAPISRGGPARLPGGITAYKFRDPDGHPLELIQFPTPNPATAGGIDHSAIVVSDVARSIGFYQHRLGLRLAARQQNTGAAQDALDGLDGAVVEVVALAPRCESPHLELLGYRSPPGAAAPNRSAADLAATRIVFQAGPPDDEPPPCIVHDPDGHALVVMWSP